MSNDNLPVSRKENIVVQEVGDELMIYDLDKNKAFCLNQTSAAIWHLCDGKKSLLEISEEFGKKSKASADENLVWLALDQLKREGLVSGAKIESKFNGMTRREVIGKVGLSSMVALPLVSSLIAPSSVQAQSGAAATTCGTGATAVFSPCTTNADCGLFSGSPLCCRLLFFGPRVCLVQSSAGAQCDCTQP
jgi:hypothetical protein